MNRRSFLKSLSLLFFIPALAAFQKKINKVKFLHGVASGDPTNSKVIIWTRVTPENFNSSQKVIYQISKNKNFSKISLTGTLYTNSKKDFTVKADVNLAKFFPGTKFYYRFICNDTISPIGTTSTLPKGNVEEYKLAIFSCSNHPAGFFNVYKDAAEDKSIDLNIHLGDYIYEYENGGYATQNADKLGRIPIPEKEILTLHDYRLRHAQYKTDKNLQKLHQSRPMVPIWDDHEVTNDAWKYGAENHQKIEGKFNLRKRTALKAYYEWMPIREKYSKDKGWRNFEIGNLINLIILDTRLSNRDKQVNYVSYINNGKFEKDKFIEDLNNEKRNLIGKEQLRFIAKETKKKFFWNVFGQQVLISKVVLPPLPSEVLDNLSPQATFLKYINNLNLPYNTDAWDGYPAARERFLNSINTSSNNIFLAGDTHNCWAGNIANNSGIFKGVEFGTPSVSSPGGSEEFGELDVRPLEKAVTKINKDLVWTNFRNRGYLTLKLNQNSGQVSFIGVNTVKNKIYERSVLRTFSLNPKEKII